MRRVDHKRIAIQDKSRPDRNRFAEVRLSRDKVRIGEIANIRLWFRPPDRDDYLPTRTGISIPIEHIVDLVAALSELFPEAFTEFMVGNYEGGERSRSSPDLTRGEPRLDPSLGTWMEDET